MKNGRSVYILIFSLVFILTGCMEQVSNLQQDLGLADKPGPTYTSTEDKGPSQKGFLNLFLLQTDTLHPLTTRNMTVRQLSSFIFDGLFCEKEDGVIENLLAESYSFSESGSILDIRLKDNIFFHDGQALSSDDVAFSVEAIKKAGDRSLYIGSVTDIKSVKVLDRLNLRIILNKPDIALAKLTFPVVPRHIYEDWPVQGLDNSLKPVGTGAFKFGSYKDDQLILLRNDEWWYLKDPDGIRHPIWMDGIIFRVYPNESDMMQAFLKREIDIATVEEGELQAYTNRSDIFFKQYESNILEFLVLSSTGRTDSPVSQESFRETLFQYLRWYGSVNPLNMGESVLETASTQPDQAVNRDSILNSFSEAGFNYSDDKNTLSFYKNGIKLPVMLSLKYNGLQEDRRTVGQWIQKALLEIGVEVLPETASYSEQQAFMESGKFDMMLLGCRMPLFSDQDEVLELTRESLRLNNQNSVILPIYRKHGAVLYNNRIRGLKIPVWHNIYNGWPEWYIVE